MTNIAVLCEALRTHTSDPTENWSRDWPQFTPHMLGKTRILEMIVITTYCLTLTQRHIRCPHI